MTTLPLKYFYFYLLNVASLAVSKTEKKGKILLGKNKGKPVTRVTPLALPIPTQRMKQPAYLQALITVSHCWGTILDTIRTWPNCGCPLEI